MINRMLNNRVLKFLAVIAGILSGGYALIEVGRWIGDERYRLEIQSLKASLEREREENTKLRSEWERLQKNLDTTSSQLNKEQEQTRILQSTIQRLEKELNNLRRVIDERRPLLRVSFNDSEAPGKIVAIAKNSSEVPLRIIQNRGLIWLNGRPGDETSRAQTVSLPPGITSLIRTFTVDGDLTPLHRGETIYRGALCFVYEADSTTDRQRWLAEQWFEYKPDRPNGHYLSFWRQDDRSLKNASDGCNLKRLIPPGWLDIKK